MNILFLGHVYPPERVDYIKSVSCYFDNAANVLQLALLEGLDHYANVMVVSNPKMKIKQFKFPKFSYKHNEGLSHNDVILGFYSIPYFDKLFDARRKVKEVEKQGFIPDVIFLYNIRLEDLRAAYSLKKKYPNVVVVEVITDLPQYMRGNQSALYKRLKAVETKLTYDLMRDTVDGFVLLSVHMKEFVPVENKPFVIVEGIFHPEAVDNNDAAKYSEKVVFYSGQLGSRFGILDLVNAFELINNPTYRLWLCGNGDTVERIKEVSKEDSRVQYLGSLPRKQVLEIQKKATLLVNPRHSKEVYTKYSFPSKTMEYMASSTPTLMSPLASLPEDYKKHLFLFDDESVEGMSKKISEICEKPSAELERFGKDAQNFILENKTSKTQCARIVKLIEQIIASKK